MERELLASNLWRGIVAQRSFADYSYVGPSYPVPSYRLDELELYLKAAVLFYRELIEKAGIELAVASRHEHSASIWGRLPLSFAHPELIMPKIRI
ncbi:MAG: hypothetical protein ACRD3A_00440 [Terriglobales bacterium]